MCTSAPPVRRSLPPAGPIRCDVLVSQGQTADDVRSAGTAGIQPDLLLADRHRARPFKCSRFAKDWSSRSRPNRLLIRSRTSSPERPVPRAGTGPDRTVDGSGLDKNDGHSTDPKAMWQSTTVGPHWIQYEFDKVYTLHELWVWNSNQTIEPILGFGARTVKVEYSIDGIDVDAAGGGAGVRPGSGQARLHRGHQGQLRRSPGQVRQADD